MTDQHVHTVNVNDIDHADRLVASAEVTTPDGAVAHAALSAESGQLPPGSRTRLVDAVLDLPEVQTAGHLEASVPLGDTESLRRLQERTSATTVRAAGSTALVDGDLPAQPTREQ
jgi:hypothetical protein